MSKADVKTSRHSHHFISSLHDQMVSLGNEGLGGGSLSHFCSPCVDLMTELGEGGIEGGRGDESEIMGVCTDRMDGRRWMAAG